MAFVFKRSVFFVCRHKLPAGISLIFNFAADGAAVNMYVKNRKENRYLNGFFIKIFFIVKIALWDVSFRSI